MTGLVQSIITIVLFIAILGILVVIHEIGHFVTARLSNVRVLEFGVGFPPRARVLRNKGETLYTLNWLPIGGFVKLEGEDGDSADDPRSFSVQPWWKKMVILVAGVVEEHPGVRHLHRHRPRRGPDHRRRDRRGPAGPPAATAGLMAGDEIVSIDGEYFNALGGSNLRDALQTHAGETGRPRHPASRRTTSTVTVTLRDAAAVAAGQGALGVSN